MTEKKKVRIVIEFPYGSKPHQMLEELKEERASPTNPPIIIEALVALHRKSFPGSYYTAKRSKLMNDDEDKTQEEIMIEQEKNKRKREQIKDKVLEDERRAIAKKLNGKVIEKDRGTFVVEYYNYNMGNRSKVVVPLSMMDDFLVDKQYYPDADTVLRLQSEGKVTYPVYSSE